MEETIHASSVYIPLDRRQAMVQGVALPERTSGAALFADISGFTPLAEALTQTLGPRQGAEELTHQLNRVYDTLIAQVHRYRGSVISFSGDAITCWFAEPHASLHATACAMACQAAMTPFAAVALPGGGIAALAMKVGLASGPVQRFLVGDPDIQLVDTLAGQTLARMAAAEGLASQGQVVIDAPTATCLDLGQMQVKEAKGGRFFVVEELRAEVEPAPWLPLPPGALSEEQVRPWLLPAIYERLRLGLGEFLMELRSTAVLFVRFQGIDYDADKAAGTRLDAYIRWVQGCLSRYGGTLLQLTIGDKGSSFYAAFGAPTAHEDDARRAASAAWELLTPPAGLDLVQIGISQGTVRAGAYGGTARRTYGVIGDEVNVAARLMQAAAAGEVLVSKRVQEALPGDLIEPLPPLHVKGKAQALPVARLLGKSQARTRPVAFAHPLVGREAELEALLHFLTPVWDKFAGIAYVYGEAGVGKSHLAYELRQRLMQIAGRQSLMTWFTCRAEPILHQSLNPFRSLLRGYFEQSPADTEKANKARFDETLDALIRDVQAAGASDLATELERTRSMLGALVDLYWVGSLYEQLEPKLRFENTLAAFKAFIQAQALRQALVLHIEDAHWLDADSLELLKELARNVAAYPFAVLLTGRYQDDGSRFRVELGDGVPQYALDLNVLPPASLQVMAEHVLAGQDGQQLYSLSSELAAFLTEMTNGNPLFVEQLALDLRERGLIGVERELWLMTSRSIEQVPASISAVLVARLDRLVAQVKATVQTAAVLGREFQVQVLSRMLRDDAPLRNGASLRNDEMALAAVKQAEAEMIWLALTQVHYIFTHALLRDAAYDMQLHSRLRALHGLAGEAIEQVYGADLGPHYGDLAYHYGKAGSTRQELNYARLAGERAAARFANHEAIAYFTQALRGAGQLDEVEMIEQRQAIHAALGELLVTTGRYDQAKEHLDQALALAQAREEYDAQARACRWLARMYELRGEYPPALEWIQQGLEALKKQGSAETVELSLIAGLIYTRQGNYGQAQECAQNALHIAHQLDDLSVLARSHSLIGVIHLRGNSALAIEPFQRAFDLYKRAGDLSGQANSHNLIANAYFDAGQLQEADQHYRRAREIFNRMGDIYHTVFADNNLGEIALKQGRLDEALAFYQKALRSLEQIGGSIYVLGVLHNNLGATFIRSADVEAGLEHLDAAQAFFEQAQARDVLPEMHRHRACAALLAGKLSEAEAHGQQALGLARELAVRAEEGNALRVLGEIAARQGRFETAIEYLYESIAILEQVGDEYEQARSQLSLAMLHASLGDCQSAGSAVEACLPVFERLGAKLDLDGARTLRSSLPSAPQP